jgi:hypothetical protein
LCALSGLTIESEFVLTGAAMAAMQMSIECEGSDIFVVADGVKIAKLGHSETPQANIWISLEPGWTVRACDDGDSIEVEYNRQRMH